MEFAGYIMRDIEEHVDHQDGQDVARHSSGLGVIPIQEKDSQQNVDLRKKY